MIYLLDTNICIYLISNKTGFSEAVRGRFQTLNSTDIRISAITSAELYHGAAKSNAAEKSRQKVDLFFSPFEILEFDKQDSVEYGKIKAYLERNGTPIGSLDNMIAAQAIIRNYTLVSNNTREFERIPGLKLENWVKG